MMKIFIIKFRTLLIKKKKKGKKFLSLKGRVSYLTVKKPLEMGWVWN